MTKEQYFFLECLSTYLHGKQLEISDNIDISIVSDYAKKHQVQGIIYKQSKIANLEKGYAKNVYDSVKRNSMILAIETAFSKQGIQYLFFKGAAIAENYPISSLRTMGDVDLLVHIEDKTRAHCTLIDLGAHCISQGSEAWVYNYQEIEIELHHRLLYDRIENTKIQLEFADNVWNHASNIEGYKYVLEPEYHLVYILQHLKMHLLAGGVGFRQFMDLIVIYHKVENIEKVGQYIEKVNLKLFA